MDLIGDRFLEMSLNEFYFRKDVRLPVQLQRAMAAEAEAAREARAKVSAISLSLHTSIKIIMLNY